MRKNKVLGFLRRLFLHNLTLKLVSLLFAIIIWSFVVSSMTTMRIKSFDNITIRYTNEAALETAGLALADEPEAMTQTALARVDIARSQYEDLLASDVTLTVDLSQVQQAGEVTLPIAMQTTRGTRKSTTPAEVTLHVDELVTATVPVEAVIEEEPESTLWRGETVLEPSRVTVSGPKSVVDRIAVAQVPLDLSEESGTYRGSITYDFVDADGEPVTSSRLRVDTATVAVTVPLLAKQRYSLNEDDAIKGSQSLPEGYEIKDIEIYPAAVSIAGENIENMKYPIYFEEQLDVSGKTGDVTGTLKIKANDGVTLLDPGEVEVTVRIGEITQEVTRKVPVAVRNQAVGYSLEGDAPTVEVKLELAYSQYRRFSWDYFTAYVDAEGKGRGTYELPVSYEFSGNIEAEKVTISPAKTRITLQ